MDIITAVVVSEAIAAFAVFGWRWLEKLNVSREATRDAFERATRARLDDLGSRCADIHEHAIKTRDVADTAYQATGGHFAALNGQRAEFERRLDDHVGELKALDGGVKEALARCDKNSTAIVNTAEAMQKLLNEKFTAIALQRGVNQRAG